MSTNRTLRGSYLQSVKYFNRPFVAPQNSTLNQFLGIEATQQVPSGQYPAPAAICIGTGGITVAQSSGNVPPTVRTLPHEPTHTGFYNQLPFVMRLQSNDLTSAERAMFALRRTHTHNANNYFQYFGLRFDTTNLDVDSQMRTVTNNGTSTTTTSDTYVHPSSDLTPTPITLPPANTIPTINRYAAASSLIPLVIPAWVLAEIRNSALLLYGDADKARITEIGIVTGLDKTVAINSGTFNELIAAQVAAWMSEEIVITPSSNSITKNIDMLSLSAMLGI